MGVKEKRGVRTRTREWNRKYCNILQLTRTNFHVLNMCKFNNHTLLFYTHMVVCLILSLKDHYGGF